MLVTWSQGESKTRFWVVVVVATWGVRWQAADTDYCLKTTVCAKQILLLAALNSERRETMHRGWPLDVRQSSNSSFCSWSSAYTFDRWAVVTLSSPPQLITLFLRPLSRAQTWFMQVFCLRSSQYASISDASSIGCKQGKTDSFVIVTHTLHKVMCVTFLIRHKQNTHRGGDPRLPCFSQGFSFGSGCKAFLVNPH